MEQPQLLTLPAEGMRDEHVRLSRRAIAEAAAIASPGFAAVLGCGRCGEIPIRVLGGLFKRVDLVELDGQALKDVEDCYHAWPDTRGKFALFHADLTGLLSPVEQETNAILSSETDPVTCLEALGYLLESTPAEFWISPEERRYDLVICSGVLTQLQASVRAVVESTFLNHFPDQKGLLSKEDSWRCAVWRFARKLEDDFVKHLALLAKPEAIIYLADTVHVCWLIAEPGVYVTEGAWVATRTSRLADYVKPHYKLLWERQWEWLRKEREGPYWGRLYGVQAIVFQPAKQR